MRISLLVALSLTGCTELFGGGDDAADAADDFADALGRDLEWITVRAEDVADAAGTLEDSARDDTEECYDGGTDCRWCVQASGGPLGGSFSAAPEALPCGGSVGAGGRTASWTLSTAALDGQWQGNVRGDYAISMTGGTSGSLEIDRLGLQRSWTSSLSVDSAEVQTVSFAFDGFAVSLSYDGFGERTWTAEASGDTTAFTGSASSSDGITCTVSGAGTVEVACAAP